MVAPPCWVGPTTITQHIELSKGTRTPRDVLGTEKGLNRSSCLEQSSPGSSSLSAYLGRAMSTFLSDSDMYSESKAKTLE